MTAKNLIIVFVLTICCIGTISSQDQPGIDKQLQIDSTKQKSINEINYQMLVSLGYSHIWNIKGKFLLGTGFHLGVAVYKPKYSDFFLYSIFSRNLFSKNKFNRKFDYDIGVFNSFSFQTETAFLGITSTVYYNFWKLKIGMNMLTGPILQEWEVKFFPAVVFSPILVFRF
jgi:hypothetical protein